MEQGALVFSILFFIAFAIYSFFGIYVIHTNPKADLNRLFFAICISLCFWSLGFSIANSAPTLETCLIWRRVSAIGWGSIYCLLLHYFILLTTTNRSQRRWRLLPLLYLPAVISIYAFALSEGIASAQYDLVQGAYGWVNRVVKNGWTVFFDIYYVGYVVSCLIILWRWGRRAIDQTIRTQANLLFIAIAAALFLGSLTDAVLNAVLKNPLPQMAPVLTLIPVLAIYYSAKRYNLMGEADEFGSEPIINEKTMRKLYLYLSLAFFAGGFTSVLAYFLPHMVQSQASVYSMLFGGGLFFLLGIVTLLAQSINDIKLKESTILAAMLCSIPAITLQFVEYASVTIWVFPFVLMIFSLVFSTRLPLLLLTAVAVVTQMVVWMNAPAGIIELDRFDYIARISIILVAFWVGSFVNRTYIRKLEDNSFQIDFQRLVSEISFDFVSVNQADIDEKIDAMMGKIGRFFRVDRTYVYLIDHQDSTMTHTHEWCAEGIVSQSANIQAVPLNIYPWWMEQLNCNKLVRIEDVNRLPEAACTEKEHLTRQGTKSAVVVPIEDEARILGFMGLDSVVSARKWSNHQIELLRILANLLADALIRIESEKEIRHMAYYDHLTALPNRILFSDRLTQAIDRAKRNKTSIGVILIDLDSFRTVNDTLGYSGGDDILKEVAQGLVQRLHRTDTVARFGGDEFLIMLDNLSGSDNVIKTTENIMQMFEHPFTVHGQNFFITGSAGVAVYPFDGEDAASLLKNADIAMYTAKSGGKNRYVVCTAGMKEAVKRNIELSNDLYKVLERSELAVYYQPQIRLNTGRIVGLEALLRWRHPELGMVAPNIFIPLAEVNGTINDIGEWVLKTSIQQNKKWQDMGLTHLRIAVNLSVIQLNNPHFADNVRHILQEAALNPEYLELEVTEGIATHEAAHISGSLNKLKQLGVSISIDDFGTKYSSLTRLKELPIDRIKIDMQFVQGVETSEKDQVISATIINLAESLGLEVLAEGVETAEQSDFFMKRRCHDVQGYYYYRPMPVEELEQLLIEESLNHTQTLHH